MLPGEVLHLLSAVAPGDCQPGESQGDPGWDLLHCIRAEQPRSRNFIVPSSQKHELLLI